MLRSCRLLHSRPVSQHLRNTYHKYAEAQSHTRIRPNVPRNRTRQLILQHGRNQRSIRGTSILSCRHATGLTRAFLNKLMHYDNFADLKSTCSAIGMRLAKPYQILRKLIPTAARPFLPDSVSRQSDTMVSTCLHYNFLGYMADNMPLEMVNYMKVRI